MKKMIIKLTAIALIISVLTSFAAMPASASSTRQAALSTHEVYVNGHHTGARGYLIDGANYFLLRDLGKAFNISVGWDAVNRVILLDTMQPYSSPASAVGQAPARATATAVANQEVHVNGAQGSDSSFMIKFDSYMINGNNYVPVRTMAIWLNVRIEYSEATGRVDIDTSRPYGPIEQRLWGPALPHAPVLGQQPAVPSVPTVPETPEQPAWSTVPMYTATTSSAISIRVNGSYLWSDQQPIVQNGRTLVPLRVIFEALGATVGWNQASQTITATRRDVTVTLQVGSNTLIRNGRRIELDVPAQIAGGRTLVPVRAVAESFDADVEWDQSARIVDVRFISRIDVNAERLLFGVGEQFAITVQVFPENIRDKTVSVDVSGATLLSPGNVLCDRGGEITVTVTAPNGVSGVLVVSAVDLTAYANEIRQEFYKKVNAHRIQNGLRALEENKLLQAYADIRAAELRIVFGHVRPDGTAAGSGWYSSQNYVNTRFAENAGSSRTISHTDAEMASDAFFNSWKNSPGHNNHMLFRFNANITMALGLDLQISGNRITSPAIWASGY